MRLAIQYSNGNFIANGIYDPITARRKMAALIRQERRAGSPVKKTAPRVYEIGPLAFGYPILIARLIL